jgi:ankyrin repeat protein
MKKIKCLLVGSIFLYSNLLVNAQVFELENPKEVIKQSKDSSNIIISKDSIILEKNDDDIMFVQDEISEEEKAEEDRVVSESFSIALQSKKYEEIENYLGRGFNINIDLFNGNNIAILSAMHRDVKLLKFITEKKANLSHLNKNGESLIYWGSAGNNFDYILEVKSRMSAKDFANLIGKITLNKRTPLHAAVLYSGNIDIINFLIENKVNLDGKDSNGQTALHYAASMNKWDILELLVNAGGKLSEVDLNGDSVEKYIIDKIDIFSIDKIYPLMSDIGKKNMQLRFSTEGSSFEDRMTKINSSIKTKNHRIRLN